MRSMKNEDGLFLKIVGLLLLPLLVMWHGYVLSVMWRWFVVPALGAPALSVGRAIGLSLVIGLFLSEITMRLERLKTEMLDDDDKDGLLAQMCTNFLLSLLFLGYGAIVHAFL